MMSAPGDAMNPRDKNAQTRAAPEAALQANDWALIGELDQECRAPLEAINHATVDHLDMFRVNLEALLVLYRQLLDASRNERGAVYDEMNQFRQAKNAAKVYHLFS